MSASLGYRRWTLAMVIVAVGLMTATQVIAYPDPHYAGAKLWWNVIFQYPVMLLAIVLAFVGSFRALFFQPWKTTLDRTWNLSSLLLGLLPLAFVVLLIFEMRERQRKVDEWLRKEFPKMSQAPATREFNMGVLQT